MVWFILRGIPLFCFVLIVFVFIEKNISMHVLDSLHIHNQWINLSFFLSMFLFLKKTTKITILYFHAWSRISIYTVTLFAFCTKYFYIEVV